ncbi:MAG: helix-turn-helix transcriptional regulator [Candidatus Sericytochromatia bacterium]|nr:helix-turn-helix transcriptional regulator [Candidatus Sericytochromatia bacterium]
MSKPSWLYLGSEFKKFREEKLILSQVDFAKILGISKSLVCRVESGERRYNQEILEDIFSMFSLNTYDKLKILLLSELPFELRNDTDDCSNVIKLTIELKNKGLFNLAKNLVNHSLTIFEDSVDFYVLLSTVNLMENKYEESEKNINIALNLNKSAIKSISTESDIYHNYGNIFFNMSYSYELKRIELVAKLVKENYYQKDILDSKEYKNLSNKITELYVKTEKYFLMAYELNNQNTRIIAQLSRLYFNMANLNIDNSDHINKAYEFLNQFLEADKIELAERVELSILLTIIMTFKNMEQVAIVILNKIIGFEPENILAYFAKAVVYSYNTDNDSIKLNKAMDNINKVLEISNSSSEIKLQILADFSFENLRKSDITQTRFNQLLLKQIAS